MFVVIALCVVGAFVLASTQYSINQKSSHHLRVCKSAEEIAGRCDATDPALASKWRQVAHRHFDKHLQLEAAFDKCNAYFALDIGAIIACAVYLIYTGGL